MRFGRYCKIWTKIGFASFVIVAASLGLWACQDAGSEPVPPAPAECEDASIVKMPRIQRSVHRKAVRVQGETVTIDGVKWATGDSVKSFFGGKNFKLVFVINKLLYYVNYVDGTPTVTLISQGDEGPSGQENSSSITNPLISPDGKRVAYQATSRAVPAFVQDLTEGNAEGWRVPVDPQGHPTADPHWHIENGKTYVYFATLPGLVNFADDCEQISGSTYRVEMVDDTTMGPIEATGIPGAYRGGLSQDGNFVGTSYATSAIYDKVLAKTNVLVAGNQQCNPSMNPFPVGSRNMDYMMILAFGGTRYHLVDGTDTTEGLHENLWIYNKEDKIVWQASRPDTTYYRRFDKPEWSTHPNYATAIAIIEANEVGDLLVVKVGDLANSDESEVKQAESFLKIAEGGLNSDVTTHLWVEP
jgi:hypothetical protein